jgi:hypothetical protein
MQFDQLRAVWHQHLEKPASRSEVELVARLVEQCARDMEQQILRRDVTESAIALIGIVAFSWLSVQLPNVVGKVGCLVNVAGAVLIIAKLWQARRGGRRPASSLPLDGYLSQERQNVMRQIQLLRGVAWWYISPFFIGANLFMYANSPSPVFSACFFAASFVLSVFIWRLNQEAIRTELQPLLDEIDRVARQLSVDAQTDRGTS